MDSDQYSFLNPTMRDVILSTLEQDSFGKNAKQKRAHRRMCMVDDSAASYSKQLNSPAQIEKFSDQNFLVAIMAGMRLEKDNDKQKVRPLVMANQQLGSSPIIHTLLPMVGY